MNEGYTVAVGIEIAEVYKKSTLTHRNVIP